jgi:hypothetical protein
MLKRTSSGSATACRRMKRRVTPPSTHRSIRLRHRRRMPPAVSVKNLWQERVIARRHSRPAVDRWLRRRLARVILTIQHRRHERCRGRSAARARTRKRSLWTGESGVGPVLSAFAKATADRRSSKSGGWLDRPSSTRAGALTLRSLSCACRLACRGTSRALRTPTGGRFRLT